MTRAVHLGGRARHLGRRRVRCGRRVDRLPTAGRAARTVRRRARARPARGTGASGGWATGSTRSSSAARRRCRGVCASTPRTCRSATRRARCTTRRSCTRCSGTSAGAALLIWLDRKLRLGYGRVFWLYVVVYTTGRLWIEMLRIDPAHDVPGLAAQRLDVDHRRPRSAGSVRGGRASAPRTRHDPPAGTPHPRRTTRRSRPIPPADRGRTVAVAPHDDARGPRTALYRHHTWADDVPRSLLFVQFPDLVGDREDGADVDVAREPWRTARAIAAGSLRPRGRARRVRLRLRRDAARHARPGHRRRGPDRAAQPRPPRRRGRRGGQRRRRRHPHPDPRRVPARRRRRRAPARRLLRDRHGVPAGRRGRAARAPSPPSRRSRPRRSSTSSRGATSS